ncbi:MAG TPA: hypothetical protein VL086_05720 [Candidatus Nitrosotalea sp.]|nr:hypothetical protein [Candidatus Nitrosotalea sp.]
MASAADDAIEALFSRGVTDGLPVVPPTATRVAAAVAASGRSPDELVAEMPPRFGRATVQRIAINAVMAGCRPDYFPVVLAAVEAICDDRFCLLGVSGTTDAVAPLVIVNGPIRKALDINTGAGVFGPGWRANATIGRAVRLCWVNIGGAQPAVISMSTFGGPSRYSACIGENEEASPWEPLHVEHGFDREDSTVAVLAAEAPQIVADTRSRTAVDLLTTIARSVEVVAHHKAVGLGDTGLVFSPEHVKTLAADGWSKARAREFLWQRLQKPVRDLVPGRDGGEGLSDEVLATFADGSRSEMLVPKFQSPENLKLLVAGGPAGRFTAIIPGWPFRNAPSRLVFRKVA